MKKPCSYVEVKIMGRTCYVTQEDLEIFYCMAGNTTGALKPFNEIPQDAYVLRLIWNKKWERAHRIEKKCGSISEITKPPKPPEKLAG